LLQMYPAFLTSLYHPTHYTSENAQSHLEGSGLHCPSFDLYADKLVDFILAHLEIDR
jgi:hypothetical protein